MLLHIFPRTVRDGHMLWSEKIYPGGQHVNVSAGLGQPAVFHRTLSIEGIELAHKIRGAVA